MKYLLFLFAGLLSKKNVVAQSAVMPQQSYQYKMESIGYSDIKKLYSSDSVNAKTNFFRSVTLQKSNIKIECTIRKTLVKLVNDSTEWCYSIEHPLINFSTDDNSLNTGALAEDLKEVFFVQTDPTGIVGNIYFKNSISEVARGIAKEIISSIQFCIPEKHINAWNSTEQNTVGTYLADYKVINADKLETKIGKTLDKYTLLKENSFFSGVKFDYTATAVLNKQNVISSITASSAQVLLNQKDTLSATAYKLNLMLLTDKIIGKSDYELLIKLQNSDLYAQGTTLSAAMSTVKLNQLVYKSTLGADDWETLKIKLSQSQNKINEKAADSLVLKLRALFYLEPQFCKEAIVMVENEGAGSSATQMLIQALSITESFAATDALAVILTNKNIDTKLIMSILPALATTKFPTIYASDRLRNIAFSAAGKEDEMIVSTAQLALGALAGNLTSMDSVAAQNIVRFLIDNFQNSADTLQKILVLGNTSSVLIFPVLKSLIDAGSASEEIRLEAINALKRLENKEVISYLLQLKNKGT